MRWTRTVRASFKTSQVIKLFEGSIRLAILSVLETFTKMAAFGGHPHFRLIQQHQQLDDGASGAGALETPPSRTKDQLTVDLPQNLAWY